MVLQDARVQRVLGAPAARDDAPLASVLLAVMPRLRAAEAVALLGADRAPVSREFFQPLLQTAAQQCPHSHIVDARECVRCLTRGA